MKSSFVLALGLAAIDGLTSAFVAMLILALAVIGAGSSGGGDTKVEQSFLQIARPRFNFLVRVSPDCKSPGVLRAPIVGGSRMRLSEIDRFTNRGSVYWNEACGSNELTCSAQLTVNNGVFDNPWCIDLAIANSPSGFTENLKRPIEVKLVLQSKTGEKPLPAEQWTVDGCWHEFEFSPKANVLQSKGSKC